MTADSPSLLIAAVLALLGGSLIVMAWGRRIPRHGDWLVSLGLVTVIAMSCNGWSLLADAGFAPQSSLFGWIWPRGETGAITVGVLRDCLGVSMAVLAALVAASVLVGADAQTRESRPGRFYAALGLSASGVALAWFALTPWLSLTGTAVAVFGGFLALGARWDTSAEALLAARFGWERSWGLLTTLLGLCALAGGRAPLGMLRDAGDPAWASGGDLLGATLMFLGAFAQLQPFPLLGWVMRESESSATTRVVLAQVFPAWAVFGLLLRLEPRLREAGVFPDLGCLALASSVLASISGVLSGKWKLSLGAWVSAGFSLVVAVLSFAGPAPAFALAIGLGLGASALAGFAGALESGGSGGRAGGQRVLWAKVGCILAAAAGTGAAGFVSAGGCVHAISLAWAQPVLAGVGCTVFFMFALLGWKVAWQAMAGNGGAQAPWTVVLAPYVPILLALGLTWTGTLSGAAIPGNPDQFFSSTLVRFFGPAGDAWGDAAGVAPASLLYWALIVVAFFVAYWTAGSRPDFWPSAARKAPKFAAFVTTGYGVDRLVARVRDGLSWTGEASGRFFERDLRSSWLAKVVARATRRGVGAVASADLSFSRGLGTVVRRWVETPSRALQLIQNGDVQWYLFFAVGSGIAILAHFMIKN